MIIHQKNFLKKTPNWQSFLDNLNFHYNNPLNLRPDDGAVVLNKNKTTNIYMLQKLGLHCWHVRTQDGINLEELKEIYNSVLLNNRVAKQSVSAKMVLNFVGNEESYNIHKDPQHVISMQCIGNIEYRIYEDFDLDSKYNESDLKYESYHISAGDIFYMSPGTIHQVVVTEPRATVLIDFFIKDDGEFSIDIVNPS